MKSTIGVRLTGRWFMIMSSLILMLTGFDGAANGQDGGATSSDVADVLEDLDQNQRQLFEHAISLVKETSIATSISDELREWSSRLTDSQRQSLFEAYLEVAENDSALADVPDGVVRRLIALSKVGKLGEPFVSRELVEPKIQFRRIRNDNEQALRSEFAVEIDAVEYRNVLYWDDQPVVVDRENEFEDYIDDLQSRGVDILVLYDVHVSSVHRQLRSFRREEHSDGGDDDLFVNLWYAQYEVATIEATRQIEVDFYVVDLNKESVMQPGESESIMSDSDGNILYRDNGVVICSGGMRYEPPGCERRMSYEEEMEAIRRIEMENMLGLEFVPSTVTLQREQFKCFDLIVKVEGAVQEFEQLDRHLSEHEAQEGVASDCKRVGLERVISEWEQQTYRPGLDGYFNSLLQSRSPNWHLGLGWRSVLPAIRVMRERDRPRGRIGELLGGGSVASVLAGDRVVGTGFFVRPVSLGDEDEKALPWSPWMITSYHVVEPQGSNNSFPIVTFERAATEGRSLGVVSGFDESRDLALIHTADCGVPLNLRARDVEGEVSSLRVLDRVFTIGHPAGSDFLSYSTTEGVVSAIRVLPQVPSGPPIAVIQHSATATGGNSGGPLLAYDGFNVVGVHDSEASGTVDDFGFAIHFEEIWNFLDDVGRKAGFRAGFDICEDRER